MLAQSPTALDVHPPGFDVAIHGTRLWVEREGSGEPLLLLAGGPASSHLTFHPAFSALADEYEVIYVDYRGRGRSDPVDDYRTITFAQDVADIEALRDALGIERLHIYGFSYGGMIAQAYALAHPARVSSLVLANTVHSPEMWQKNHENINREIANQFPDVWDEIVRLRTAGVRSNSPEIQALYRVHARSCDSTIQTTPRSCSSSRARETRSCTSRSQARTSSS